MIRIDGIGQINSRLRPMIPAPPGSIIEIGSFQNNYQCVIKNLSCVVFTHRAAFRGKIQAVDGWSSAQKRTVLDSYICLPVASLSTTDIIYKDKCVIGSIDDRRGYIIPRGLAVFS